MLEVHIKAQAPAISHSLSSDHLPRHVRLKRPVDGVQDNINDLGRGLVRETLGQRGAAGVQDMDDGLLGADLGDVFREGTSEPLERGPGRPGELGGLPAQAGLGLLSVLGQGEEDQDARRGFKGCAPPVKLGCVVIGLEGRAWLEVLGLARVLGQPGPHDVEHSNCSVPLLAISELGVEMKKAGRSLFSMKRPGVESGLKWVLNGLHVKRLRYLG